MGNKQSNGNKTPRGLTSSFPLLNLEDENISTLPNDIEQLILDKSIELNININDTKFSEYYDKNDKFKYCKSDFFIPKHTDNSDVIYLCGNSLGLQPKNSQVYVSEEMNKWATSGVEGHFTGKRPWAKIDETVTSLSAEIVGAKPSEVSIMNTLSVNLHLMLISFYRPTSTRFKIIMEDYPFCSDSHVVASQLKLHGYNVDDSLVLIKPRTGEDHIRHSDIISTINLHCDTVAVVLIGFLFLFLFF